MHSPSPRPSLPPSSPSSQLASLLSTNAWFTFCDRELALSAADQLSEFDVVMERAAAQERAVQEADESDLVAAGGVELVWLVRPDVPPDELLTVKATEGAGGGGGGGGGKWASARKHSWTMLHTDWLGGSDNASVQH